MFLTSRSLTCLPLKFSTPWAGVIILMIFSADPKKNEKKTKYPIFQVGPNCTGVQNLIKFGSVV